jgi:hypothetical protein
MPIAKQSVMSAMRTCGGSEKSDAKSGSARATIIVGIWRGRQSSASRRSSEISCKLVRSIINSKSYNSRVRS